MELYDQMLRNGFDYQAVSRLFTTAELSRAGEEEAELDGAPRKSKRERVPLRPALPGEADSEEEEDRKRPRREKKRPANWTAEYLDQHQSVRFETYTNY